MGGQDEGERVCVSTRVRVVSVRGGGGRGQDEGEGPAYHRFTRPQALLCNYNNIIIIICASVRGESFAKLSR